MTNEPEDVFCSSHDGLRIHARQIGPHDGSALPVFCLPGLTRTTADFETLAHALAHDPRAPRRVISVDYRGRGLSDHDPNVANYAVPVELGDVLAVAAYLGIAKAIVVGTSRGGIIAMVMASSRPEFLAGVVLNDVGPVLDIDGLMFIKSYIGNQPVPATWADAAAGLKKLFAREFPALDQAGWDAWARRAFRETPNGALIRTYDPALAQTFAAIDPTKPQPALWPFFDTLKNLPLMLIHGQLSGLLKADSVRDMVTRRPDVDLVAIADQGHAPLLADEPTMARIAAFCVRCDAHHAKNETAT